MCNNNPCVNSSSNPCLNLGPFTAVNPICEVPPAEQPVNGSGSRIPFASGAVPVILTTLVSGLAEDSYFIGYGTAIANPSVLGLSIDLTGAINEAFAIATAGIISAISASFTVITALDTGNSTVTAQIYRAQAGSSTFLPTDAKVDLAPTLAGITAGITVYGSSSSFTPVPVAVGDRLLMVISMNSTSVVAVATGSVSAGITIV